MNRNLVGAGIVLGAILLGFLLRPRGGPTPATSTVQSPVGERSTEISLPPPEHLRRPAQLGEIRKAVQAAKERGEDVDHPTMAAPPMDPSLAQADAPPARSAWPATAEGIQGAVAEAMPELRECYDGWLVENPELEGRIVASLAIDEVDGIGQITAADVAEATTGHGAFESCITSVLSELQFDPPAGGGTLSVTYPFLFERDE